MPTSSLPQVVRSMQEHTETCPAVSILPASLTHQPLMRGRSDLAYVGGVAIVGHRHPELRWVARLFEDDLWVMLTPQDYAVTHGPALLQDLLASQRELVTVSDFDW